MAVYTHVPAEDIARLLADYGLGALRSAKGIAEGVENSNYLVDADGGRFILTLYEKRVDAADLPFFMALLDHLADRGLPVPRAVKDQAGAQIRELCGRPACLIEFLSGVSPSAPSPAQAHAAGEALGRMHAALADFAPERPNTLGLPGWHDLAARCGDAVDAIRPGLAAAIAEELAFLDAYWPRDLPRSVIHADLFPDNVLITGDAVTGMIDFYFACTEIRAWDVAVTHSAWAFSADGQTYWPEIGDAILAGYAAAFPMSDAERAALPILARGSALRFTLTRAWDWLNTPADALVTRKDPLAFMARLELYQDKGAALFAAA